MPLSTGFACRFTEYLSIYTRHVSLVLNFDPRNRVLICTERDYFFTSNLEKNQIFSRNLARGKLMQNDALFNLNSPLALYGGGFGQRNGKHICDFKKSCELASLSIQYFLPTYRLYIYLINPNNLTYLETDLLVLINTIKATNLLYPLLIYF